MLKVMIVDDEPSVLNNMGKVIDWEKQGFQICATADSGEKACQLQEKHRPDLVITDVMMPQMNGIELAEYINKKYPDTEMIVISGYDEFDFAKSAMKAGVMEYILKPTNKLELEAALNRVHERICKKQRIEKNTKEWKQQAERSIPVLKNQFFNELCSGMQPGEQNIISSLQFYKSPLKGVPYRVWCFNLDRDETYADNPEMRELIWIQLRIIIREEIEGRLRWESFVRGRFLFYIVEAAKEEYAFEEMEECLEKILGEFKNLTRISLSVGISREYTDYAELYSARKDCEIALEERCNLGEGSCIFYDEVMSFSKNRMEYDHEMLQQICMKLRALNKEGALEYIQKMYRDMRKRKAIYQQFYSQTVFLLTELFSIAEENQIREKLVNILENLEQYKTGIMLENVVCKAVDEIIEYGEKQTSNKNKEIVEAVKKYVKDHMRENITLTEVADSVHLSKNYLCSIFKKEQNETFFSYLTKTRMEKAKELLRTTDDKVYYIAEITGYTDYTYFSQVFKKYTGVTAGEYREIYSGE